MSDSASPTVVKKQFIAGAICPACDDIDRIVVEQAQQADDQAMLSRRRCVSCGYADPFEIMQDQLQAIPKGRPERPRVVSAVEPTVVRLVDP